VVCSDAATSQPFVRPSLYKGYRYPPEIISYGVWLEFENYEQVGLWINAAAGGGAESDVVRCPQLCRWQTSNRRMTANH
jgi:hypothetical protein